MHIVKGSLTKIKSGLRNIGLETIDVSWTKGHRNQQSRPYWLSCSSIKCLWRWLLDGWEITCGK